MKNIALISSSENAYSETFIQMHKNYLRANIFYYYDGMTHLADEGPVSLSRWKKIIQKVKFSLRISHLTVREFAIMDSFKKHHIEKVYAEFGTMGVAAMPICKKLNIPLIVNFHGYDVSIKQILIDYEKDYKELFEFAEGIVVVSEVMRSKVISLGADPQKIVCTPCAPDESFYDVKPTFLENSFIALGRFVDKKAPYYTIFAFKMVLAKYPETTLYIGGEGLLYNVCLNLVNYLKISERVVFLGIIKRDDILKIYQRVIGFVQHSITALNGDMEGTPVAVLEASASGLPVVSTRHAGIPEVIRDGITGFLVDEHDVDKMADWMIHLIENKDQARKMGEAGKIFIKSNFSMDKHIEILNKLLLK